MDIKKSDFVDQLREKHNYTKGSAEMLVDDFWDILADNMEAGNTVSFYGYGCFDMVKRAARSCPNPVTKERCDIPEHWVPKFYPGERLKKAVRVMEDNERREVV